MVDEANDARSHRKSERRRRVLGGRQHRHVVRVTPEEEARLLSLALEYHVSVPKLLVDSALAGGADAASVNASERKELLVQLFAAHRLLAGIANNVNQIARQANSTSEIPSETNATLAAARRAAERIDELCDQLAGELS